MTKRLDWHLNLGRLPDAPTHSVPEEGRTQSDFRFAGRLEGDGGAQQTWDGVGEDYGEKDRREKRAEPAEVKHLEREAKLTQD